MTTSSCFACGIGITVAELPTFPPMWTLVEAAVDPTSGDLFALPRHVTQLAAPFRVSQFGSFRIH